jgi:hypothetical protein
LWSTVLDSPGLRHRLQIRRWRMKEHIFGMRRKVENHTWGSVCPVGDSCGLALDQLVGGQVACLYTTSMLAKTEGTDW